MAWKASFNDGVSSFRENRLDEALNHFTTALTYPGGHQHMVYDSRAAVYEKMGLGKEALRDSKRVIELSRDQWQGYARAARLFFLASKFDAALPMADAALSRIKLSNTRRRDEMTKLRGDILRQAKRLRLTHNQSSKLPVELLSEVFCYVVLDSPPTLISLLHVDGFWRNVALTTPALWHTLILTTNSPARKLALWMKQSKRRIRELYIRAHVTTHPDWPFPELAAIVWDQVRVCSSVAWDVATYVKKKRLGENALASLEELEMIEDTFCLQRASPGLFPLLPTMGLRSLSFSRSYFSWKDVSRHLTSLTSINVLHCSKDPQDLLAALAANPGLESIKILDYIQHKYSAKPPLSLPNLTHLELLGSYSASLVESINTPNLNSLIIRGASEPLNRALDTLIASQCAPHITHIVIERCSLDPSILKRFLKNAFSLSRLELLALDKSVAIVIDALAGPTSIPRSSSPTPSNRVVMPAGFNGAPILCPSLTHIAVSHSQEVRTGPLVRLIKSRMFAAAAYTAAEEGTATNGSDSHPPQKCARITSLLMDQCAEIEAQWLPWFRENIQTVSCVYKPKKKSKWRDQWM